MTCFCGIVTARMDRAHGEPVQYLVEAPGPVTDGVPALGQSQWFPEARLVIVEDDEPPHPHRNLEQEIETLHNLLDETICTCTLAKRCPQHSPQRPFRAQ